MAWPEPLTMHREGGNRPSIPIVAQIPLQIGAPERDRLTGIAARLRADEPALTATDAFGPRVAPGMTEGPAILIGDHREIPLTSLDDISVFEYRMLPLADSGDLMVISGDRSPAFESYCRDFLELGQVEVIAPRPNSAGVRNLLATRCIEHPDVFHHIVEVARKHGRLTVMPHIGMGSSWILASAIAKASAAEIFVSAPPPRLTRRVNDKLWFARRVAEVLGPRALPPIYSAFGPTALTGRVAALAERFPKVVVKIPDAAGSAGNISLESTTIDQLSAVELHRHLIFLLETLGWHNRYPLLVGVWDCPVFSSTSVQFWIPTANHGFPIFEGVFEQIIEGKQGEFVGARPANLPEQLRSRLADEAGRLAYLFQRLGYFGRCSFDAVLVGDGYLSAELHWIECNGRWGGVSIPLTLANRLVGSWQKNPFVVIQRTQIQSRKQPFATALQRLQEHLFKPGRPGGGVVMLTPVGIEKGTAIHLMALADSVAAAQEKAKMATLMLAQGKK